MILEAARHYDRDDGGRFSRLEENASQALLGGAAVVPLDGGLPVQPGAPKSGVISALAVVVIDEVLTDLAAPVGASPSP